MPSPNRLIGLLVVLLFCYLALFTWNARTGYLDTIAERSGLEIVTYVLSPVVWVKDRCVDYWHRYMALINVAEENERLRDELRRTQNYATLIAEDRAELTRLRALLQLEALHKRPGLAARVIGWRFGPNAPRKTLTINKGYLHGALPGTPVATESGVVGRVVRAAPHAATVLMLTDPGFRLAVISQKSRTRGILTGVTGGEKRLELTYVAQNALIEPGEMLITSGLDGSFPKGIPVGMITSVEPGNDILFLRVRARPVVELDRLEEVLLLQPPGSGPTLLEPIPDPAELIFYTPPEVEENPETAGQTESAPAPEETSVPLPPEAAPAEAQP